MTFTTNQVELHHITLLRKKNTNIGNPNKGSRQKYMYIYRNVYVGQFFNILCGDLLKLLSVNYHKFSPSNYLSGHLAITIHPTIPNLIGIISPKGYLMLTDNNFICSNSTYILFTRTTSILIIYRFLSTQNVNQYSNCSGSFKILPNQIGKNPTKNIFLLLKDWLFLLYSYSGYHANKQYVELSWFIWIVQINMGLL